MTTKICTQCNQEKVITEFAKDNRIKSGYKSICLSCRNSYIREWSKNHKHNCYLAAMRWKAKNPDKVKGYSHRFSMLHKDERYAAHREWELATKTEVLTHYGNGKLACVKCGFDNIKALSIDHMNGKGAEHRRQTGVKQAYSWLKKNNYPEGYQTLCMNCQWIKKYDNGEFSNPHKEMKVNDIH